jgi:hypothetical protein
MKTYEEVELLIQAFLTSALVGGEWSASRTGRFTPPGKEPQYPLESSLGEPQNRSGRRGEENLTFTETRTPISETSSP